MPIEHTAIYTVHRAVLVFQDYGKLDHSVTKRYPWHLPTPFDVPVRWQLAASFVTLGAEMSDLGRKSANDCYQVMQD